MLRRSDDRRGPACLLDASPRFLVLILVLVHSLIVPQLSSSISISAPCLPLSCVRLRGRPHRKCLSVVWSPSPCEAEPRRPVIARSSPWPSLAPSRLCAPRLGRTRHARPAVHPGARVPFVLIAFPPTSPGARRMSERWSLSLSPPFLPVARPLPFSPSFSSFSQRWLTLVHVLFLSSAQSSFSSLPSLPSLFAPSTSSSSRVVPRARRRRQT